MEQLAQKVRDGDEEGTAQVVEELLGQGANPESLLKEAMIPAMDEVGELFRKGEYFMPEMLIAARAMQAGLDILKPRLAQTGVAAAGKVVMGTVSGDLHDIGKNLVVMILEGAGFEVVDLGVDRRPEDFVAAVREHSPQLVGLSALLTTTMPAMEKTVAAIRADRTCQGVKIMVGGAPLTEEWASGIGADYYGPDAVSGKNFAQQALGEN